MDIIMDRNVCKEIFDAYILSRISPDEMNFNKFLCDMSSRTHKDVSYLKFLVDYYYREYANEKEKLLYKSIKYDNIKFIDFCDELISLEADKRIDYLVNSCLKVSELKSYFDSYKRYNKESVLILDSLFLEYTNYLEASRIRLKEEKRLINFKKACAFYQNLIDLGFYSIGNYCDFYGYDRRKMTITHKKYRNMIKCVDPSKYSEFMELFEINREKSYFFLKDRIDRFNSDLRDAFLSDKKYDIIDYYLTVGISLNSFKEICSGFITQGEMCNFNRFSNKYNFLEYCDYDEYEVISSVNIINDRKITDSEKAMVYSFLKENDIPLVYFNIALYKYACGELDNYIGGYIKKKKSSV